MSRRGESDAAIWERLFRHHADEFRAAAPTVHQQDCLAFLQQHRARTVLDIGCGIGRWAVYLARAGLDVSGFDLSRTGIEVARRWAAEEGLQIELEVASVADPVFEGRRFDAVVAAMVLDNLPTAVMTRALEKIECWLAPEGLFYGLFNPYLTSAEVEKLAASPNPTTRARTHYYTDDELERLLSGFEILSARSYAEGVRARCMRRGGGVS